MTEGEAEMFLFGTIGDDLVCGDFVRELRALSETNGTIVIHINSGGGSVFDGLAMYEALKKCTAKTIGKIDGLCASMATIVALAMDEVHMSKNAQFMTHKASGYASGSADDLKTYASMMDDLENVLSAVYSKKTGLAADGVKAKFLKGEDTWFSAQQALEAKLIDGIYDSDCADTITVPKALKSQQEIIAFYNSHFTNFKKVNMKQFVMSAGQLAALNLTATAEAPAVANAIDSLIAKAKEADGLKTQLDSAILAKSTVDLELTTLKGKTVTDKVDGLLAKALDVDKKTTVAMNDTLRKKYITDPEGLEALLNTMQPLTIVTNKLKEGGEDKKYAGTWNELDKAGKLDKLKAENIDLFKAKYKEEFEREYTA